MLDVGAVAARAGPPVPAEEEAAALVPAIEGAWRRGPGVPVSADTFSLEVARRALAAGAEVVNDISGGSEEMFELVAETRLRLRPDAHRGAAAGRPALARVRRRRRPPAGPGSRGESSWPGSLGSPRSRSRSTPDSTSTSAPSRTSRSCGASASCASSGCRSTSRSRARTSSAPSSPAPGRSGCRRASASGGRSPPSSLAVRGRRRHPPHPRPQLAAGDQGCRGDPEHRSEHRLMAKSPAGDPMGDRDRPRPPRRPDRRRELRGGARGDSRSRCRARSIPASSRRSAGPASTASTRTSSRRSRRRPPPTS